MSTLQTYIVTSSLPVVVEEDGKSTSYNPGDVFEALDTNVSVTRLLSLGSIVPFVGQPVSGPMVISQGDQGPVGPTGPPGPGGESNTASSSGGDESLVLPKVGVDLRFKGLSAGAGVTLTPSPIDITISATGEFNTNSNAGGDEGLALPKAGSDLPLKGLTAGTNVTLTPGATDVTISAVSTGEANTNSNAGGTVGLALTKAGADLPLRGLTAGTAITLTPSGTDVTIAAAIPDPADENNILANQVFS